MTGQKMLYIELKSGSNDRGPAWIGLATVSGSGRTVYFNGKALKRAKGGGVAGNHRDLETGEEYWVSGVKKDGSDRHWAGGGVVMVDSRVVADYCALRGLSKLDPRQHTVVTVEDTDIARFHEIENEPVPKACNRSGDAEEQPPKTKPLPIAKRWHLLSPAEWEAFAGAWLAESRVRGAWSSDVSGAVATRDSTATPEQQWQFIQAAVSQAETDEELNRLAAGEMEQFLSKHGGEFIDAVESKASADPKFARMISAVWKYRMADEVWGRVEALKVRCADRLT